MLDVVGLNSTNEHPNKYVSTLINPANFDQDYSASESTPLKPMDLTTEAVCTTWCKKGFQMETICDANYFPFIIIGDPTGRTLGADLVRARELEAV